jgi:Na+/H+-translocating membrane pyrophosphatase
LDIKNIGIRSLQLGVVIILVFSYFGSNQIIKDRFIASFDADIIASFTTIFICIASGLVIGTLIAIQSQIFVSPSCFFFKDLKKSSYTGASTNIIQGLAIGYFAPILPTILTVAVFLFGYKILGFYGVSLIGLGISTINPLVLNTINVTTILDCALCLSKQTTLNNQALFIRTDFQEAKYQ